MKLLLMSDLHFGFAGGSERWHDAFLAADEGIEAGLGADAILLAGDVFDTRLPTAETFSRAMEIFLKARHAPSDVTLEGVGKRMQRQQGIPIIAIHGNHERRVKGLVNPVEALERGGFLTHLHCNGVVLVKGQERVAIQGMSSVPGQYADAVLKEWNPSPIPGCYNILMFHQNLEGFLYTNEPLSTASVPRGFDLYLCGDIHEAHRATLHGSPLLLPGSTVATQIKKGATDPRAFARIDTSQRTVELVPFKDQRKVFYEECATEEEAAGIVERILSEQHSLKPVVKLVGKAPLDGLEGRYGERAILMASQETDALPPFSAADHALSVQTSGRELLRKHLRDAGLDPRLFETVLELLQERKQEEALSLLREGRRTPPTGGGA